jgi:lipopolysaccharide transport system ATP-binding protein
MRTKETVIDVCGLSKRYVLGGGLTERKLLDFLGSAASNFATSLRSPRDSRERREFWALRNVSFQVTSGEVVGIIGNNGAGKSTLLKILSRITEPTAGEVTYSGRIGSLLEVGTGFHSELNGRDNIFLNGAILGMRRHDIVRHFDEIVDFAGVEQFLDTPVKRYSSGMYMRLAFAVAAHLDADILLVDEVLAVGDTSFQKKCLARMDKVARDGRTVLFVSHNLTAIRGLCKRTLVLEGGRLAADGETGQVLADYMKSSSVADGITTVRRWSEENAPRTDAVRVMSASLAPVGGAPLDLIHVNDDISFTCYYQNSSPGTVLKLCMVLNDQQGLKLFDTGSWDPPLPLEAGVYRTSCIIPRDLLNDGYYSLSLVFRNRQDEVLLRVSRALQFQIIDSDDGRHGWFGKWGGILRPRFPWKTEAVTGSGNSDSLPSSVSSIETVL